MKILRFLLLLLFSYSVMGQTDIMTIDGSKYYYKGEVYKCKELGPIYEQSEKALNLYNSGRKYYKVANFTFGLGFGIFGLAIVFASGQHWEETAISLGAAGLLGLLALIPRIVGDQKVGLAREAFNFNMLERHGYKSEYSLNIGTTINGMGITLIF